MTTKISRRSVLSVLAGTGAVALVAGRGSAADQPAKLKGNIRHSVCKWCYGKISLDDLCKACVDIGIQSIELTGPKEWPTLAKYGLTCAIGNGAGMGIARGFNRVENHDELVASFEKLIPQAAEAKIPCIICMSGNREGLDDEQGIKNCALGLKRLMKLAEQHQVTIAMELLNSRVNHKDYQCDHTEWGAKVCQAVGSERMKLLYDIYHMQIMEGDLIATIQKNIQYIGHFHTGGVPGRNQIDETQEINYPAVMRAIVQTGYKGFVGQEFLPKNEDPLTALRRCVQICDV